MIITWIIPDTYGFLIDELEELASRPVKLRVLSGKPIPKQIISHLPTVEFFYCPERSLVRDSLFNRVFDPLWRDHTWRLPRNSYHTKPIAGIYKVLQNLERQNPSDVIHSHFAFPGGIGGTLLKTPQILTLRGYDILVTGKYGALWNPFFRTNLLNKYSNKKIITLGSKFAVQRARQIFEYKSDLRLIKEGIPSRNFKNAGVFSRKKLGIPDEASILLSVGNLVDVKNHFLLIDVFASLIKEVDNVVLIICGEGALKTELKEQCQRLGVSEQVRFMGQLKREELTDIFSISDIFVHTSLSEGFGNVILEAMLLRLLVVANPVGVAPDIIRHKVNGFLPEFGDKLSWIGCLKVALKTRLSYNEALEENRNLVLREFGMDKRVDAYLKIYDEAIETKN